MTCKSSFAASRRSVASQPIGLSKHPHNIEERLLGPRERSDSSVVTTKMVAAELVDTRVIKSIGRYDVDGELAAEEYPEDFVIAIY